MKQPELYRVIRIGGGIKIVGNMVARGTETRNHQTSKEPYSHLETRAMSEEAKLLIAAREGDVDAELRLIARIVKHVEDKRQVEHWKMGAVKQANWSEIKLEIANIVLYYYLHSERLSQAEAARRLNCKQENYKKTWSEKLADIENRTVKAWSSQK
ncbi:hypothetical protein [uncultured Paraglaciecola sp.]|uniref:hypothetical protein n=1 Tax=uncultured Paraglaciecola sp. TaxID=1765024 RepID=UPI00260E22A9|nr:hypothetical protein [uncultured Paraglaciecola sp.]